MIMRPALLSPILTVFPMQKMFRRRVNTKNIPTMIEKFTIYHASQKNMRISSFLIFS